MATNFLKFCMAGSARLALALAAGARSSCICCATGRIYTGSGLILVGQWTFGALLFLLFHYPPQSALGRFLLFAVYIAPQLWCQSDTLLLDSLSLGEHVANW